MVKPKRFTIILNQKVVDYCLISIFVYSLNEYANGENYVENLIAQIFVSQCNHEANCLCYNSDITYN